MPLKEGDEAPEFALPADDGSTLSLSHFKGKQVVLYFFPKASTPG
jgi:peroxiredoxin Q/BCP